MFQIITTVTGIRKSVSGRTAAAATTATEPATAIRVMNNDDNGGGDGGDDYDEVDNAIVNDDDDGGEQSAVDPAAQEHNERIFRRLMPSYQQKEPMVCELCGDIFGMPISYHMLTTHPGCGHNSGGRGYTSNGTYKTGWSGACGEGGIAWYLLCESCRNNYMKRAPPVQAGSGPVRTRKTAAVVRYACTGSGLDDVNRRHQGNTRSKCFHRFFFLNP